MARLPVHTAQSAPEPTRAALAAAEQGAGYLSNLLGVLANAPVALEAYQTLSQINARAGLTLQEREVVQLVAGTRHGCTFCVAGHTALARNKAKLSPEVVDALRAQGTLPDARLQSGTTPAQLLQLLRMRVARRLLAQGAAIADAAERVGYRSQAAFSRVFQRTEGVAPSAWRRGGA